MAITNARMQMRRGLEADFDPDKMQPGEWAVSLDKKYVRMCFSPGVCVRMATYEAFEKDMEQIKEILSTCETIEEAVSKINTEVSANAQAVEEYTEQAKKYRDEAKQFRDEAETFKPDGYAELQETVASNTAKIDTIIEKAELNIKNTAKGKNLHLTDSANSKVVEFGLYGKATQDGEPTPDNPIEIVVSGSDGSVEVVSCGKNLLKNNATTQTVSGVTFTVNADGSIALSGTTTKATQLNINLNLEQSLKNGTYKLSCGNIGVSGLYFSVKTSNNVTYSTLNGTLEKWFSVKDDAKATQSYIWINSGVVCDNITLYPMIRLASDTDDTYEPYKETTSTIPTPNGIAGIKVDSGGNYTDENGQQWVCDEIVKYADGSGKRIQRIGKEVFDGSETWNYIQRTDRELLFTNALNGLGKSGQSLVPLICDYFKSYSGGVHWEGYSGTFPIMLNTSASNTQCSILAKVGIYGSADAWKEWLSSNPITVYYELAEPIITDLTAEEIAEIEKLYTFYPITNISNDSDCGMAVTYMADSKLYIDNQLAIQKAQQEETLATMLLLMPEEVQASMIENDTNNLLNESEV